MTQNYIGNSSSILVANPATAPPLAGDHPVPATTNLPSPFSLPCCLCDVGFGRSLGAPLGLVAKLAVLSTRVALGAIVCSIAVGPRRGWSWGPFLPCAGTVDGGPVAQVEADAAVEATENFPAPPDDSLKHKIPKELEGLCYNGLHPDHISVDCDKEVVCIRCGGEGHQSGACMRPRPPSPPSK